MQDSLGYENKQKYHEITAKRQVPDHRQERGCRGQDLPGEEPGSRQLLYLKNIRGLLGEFRKRFPMPAVQHSARRFAGVP
jgi:hypothetical protein